MNESNQDPTNLNLLQGKHPKTCLENTSKLLHRPKIPYADEWIFMKKTCSASWEICREYLNLSCLEKGEKKWGSINGSFYRNFFQDQWIPGSSSWNQALTGWQQLQKNKEKLDKCFPQHNVKELQAFSFLFAATSQLGVKRDSCPKCSPAKSVLPTKKHITSIILIPLKWSKSKALFKRVHHFKADASIQDTRMNLEKKIVIFQPHALSDS